MDSAAAAVRPALDRDSAPVWIEDERVFGRRGWAGYLSLTVGSAAAFWFAGNRFVAAGLVDRPSFWVLLVLVVPPLLMWELRWLGLPAMRRPRPVTPVAGLRVAVVTTFVPDAEPFAMLAETVTALVALDYPHDTWVLDEGDDPEVRRLCARVGARYFSRKHLACYQTVDGRFQRRSKHGNYNAWLYEVGFGRYDAIATFDPNPCQARTI